VHDRRPPEPDAEVLSDPVAERLLARASELDAAHGAGAAVDDLRAAAAAPMVEEAFVLRCLSPGEAAELVRPLLHLRTNTVVYSPTHAPRVLTIRATAAQIQNVRSVLDQHEGAGAPACASKPAPSVNP
jgi:hypothetical protein